MVASKDQGFMLPEGFVDECVEYEEVRPVAMWWRYLVALLVILTVGYLFYFLERTKQRPRPDEDDSGASEPVEQQSESKTSPISAALETPYRIVTETNVAQTITIKLADLLQQINLTQIFAVPNTEQQQATVRRSSDDLQLNTRMPVNESWDLQDEHYNTELNGSRRDSGTQLEPTVVANETAFNQLIGNKNTIEFQHQQEFENYGKPEETLLHVPFDQLESAIYESDNTANFEQEEIDQKVIETAQISQPAIFSTQERPTLEFELLQCTTTDEIRPASAETNSSSSPFEEIAASPRSHVSSSGDGSIEMINNDQLQAIEKELEEEEEAMLGKDLLNELESPQRLQSGQDTLDDFELNRSLTPTSELLNNQEQAYFSEKNIDNGFVQVTDDVDDVSAPFDIRKPQEEFSFDDVHEHSPSPRTLPTEISDLTEILLVPRANELATEHEQQLQENVEHIFSDEMPEISISDKQQQIEIQEESPHSMTDAIEEFTNFEEFKADTTEKTENLKWLNEQSLHETIQPIVTEEVLENADLPSKSAESQQKIYNPPVDFTDSLADVNEPKILEKTNLYTPENQKSLEWPNEQPLNANIVKIEEEMPENSVFLPQTAEIQEKANYTTNSQTDMIKPVIQEEIRIHTSEGKGNGMEYPHEQPLHESIEQILTEESLQSSVLPQPNAENQETVLESFIEVKKPRAIEEVKKLVPQQSGSLDWPDGHVKEKLEFDHYEFLPIGLEQTNDIEAFDLRPDIEPHFTSETIKIEKRSEAPETSAEACIKLESPTAESKDILEEQMLHPLQPQFAPCSRPTLQTREAKSDIKRAQHKQILSSLQQLQQQQQSAQDTATVETAIQKPSDMFQLSAIEIIEPNEKAEVEERLEAADGTVDVMKASSSRDEKRLHIPARKGSRPKIMDFQESFDTTDAPSFSEQFEKLSSLLEPTKLRIISPPSTRKTRTKSKSRPKPDKAQRKRPQTPSSLRACGVTSTQEALLKVQSLEELSGFMKQAGLERTNLIFGIDYTASNKYQGEVSFGGRCLHELSNKLLNPYQQVIRTMGRTLAPFATSGIIPAFGFGDQRTTDWSVFPLKTDSYCKSFDEVLNAYNQVTPTIVLAGPTNFAPLIYQSIEICRQMHDYHILVIVADGQVTNERATRRAIVDACKFPLSIVMVGVGDGPWDMMHVFDESLPKRPWDNFHFIDFSEVIKLESSSPEVAFAVQALLEIPDQYKRIKKLGLLNFA